jgi:hypothetical protein
VPNVRLPKKLMVVLGMLAMGFASGGLVGFALGYGIDGSDYRNPHGGLILVALLMFGGDPGFDRGRSSRISRRPARDVTGLRRRLRARQPRLRDMTSSFGSRI